MIKAGGAPDVPTRGLRTVGRRPSSPPAEAAELDALVRSIRLVVFDFDGVFTDNTVYVSQSGEEFVRCWRGDGLGLRKLDRLGIQSLILSTEANPVVAFRARKLQIECVQGVDDKAAMLRRVARRRDVPLAQTAYLGNDINDAGCLKAVGLPAAVQDAHPDVLPIVRYRTKAYGGLGAVREFCDLFEKAHARRAVRRQR